jgi:hypothetical protein
MGKSSRSVIHSTVALQFIAVLLGIAWWRAATSSRFWGDSLLYWPSAGALSVILLAIAAYRAQVRQRPGVNPRLSPLISGIAGYAVLVMLWDPFLWIEDRSLDALLVAVILPPLLCIKPLIRVRAWLALSGVVLFTTTAVACLLFNGTARSWGVGFYGRWVD